MIRIVNWILTRKCNLKCDYCAIVKNYEKMPKEYPPMKHYIQNEMTTESVIDGLKRFKIHNPDCFMIFYGGEPLLRKDLKDIIKYCNYEDIHYTIISNNTPVVQPLIKKLIDDVGEIKGFTASVDPIFNQSFEMIKDRKVVASTEQKDQWKKSVHGLEELKQLKHIINDVVAEITVMKHQVPNLYNLVKECSSHGINSDITFIDTAKNKYYDFSNITDENLLVRQTAQLADQFGKIMKDDNLDVHMKEVLIPAMWDCLPSNMDCKLEDSLHNVTIDADGSVRLCLRIRGVDAPKYVHVSDLLDSEGQINKVAHRLITKDKEKYCELCNHTCLLMSKIIDDGNLDPVDLVHLDRRAK